MKNNYLKNKVALVSGSSMGIGKAIAWELVQQGAKVILNGRDHEKLLRIKNDFSTNGFKVKSVIADIRDQDECKFLVEQTISIYGQLDILVNNAGMSSRGSIEHSADKNFTILSETNFTGAAHLSKYAIPFLKETKGHVVFINSVAGLRGMPFNSAYSASKMAQAALSEALRIELYDFGIHVGIAFVGFTQNDPDKKILDVDGSLVYLPKRNNLRLATAESVAKSIRIMIEKRKKRITLTGLGNLANFIFRYFPIFSNWLIWLNREKIKSQYTMIGGKKVIEIAQVNNQYQEIITGVEGKVKTVLKSPNIKTY
ncbi:MULTISPECIES: SDR family NAD(P)-dependent oxidoreductase [Maribacter]|uniref:Short-chain dehydrogenase n=1 Tax=Maribacter stanieri TaxID=440514 RepID=A0A1I6IIS8_9FLAO|nr:MULTISPECIES: SDR family NAD(P)-dependent oxidoreductase [Maribacter]SFR66559.1 Short-chain dehydrogenase [Maribacter stanieri]